MRLLKRIWSRIKTGTFLRIHKSTKEVDEWFRKELENPKFDFDSDYSKKNFEIFSSKPHTIILNGIEIWVSNKYYASPYVYIVEPILPYMDTTIDFFKAYNKFLEDNSSEFVEKVEKIRNV